MATISLTRNYLDGEIYTQAEIDAPYDDIETFINVTKLNDDNLQDNGITGSLKLLTGSVSTAKMADGAITTAKLADQAVSVAKILDNTITEAKMAPLSVGTPELIASSITTAKIADANVTAAKLAIDAINLVIPAGVILPFGSTSGTTGYLPCDGQSYLRTTYANLFAAIGTAYGAADGTHFNVPDLRGQFLRGVDGTAGIDPDTTTRTALKTGGNTGNNVGSAQADATGSHTHTLTANFATGAQNTAANFFNVTTRVNAGSNSTSTAIVTAANSGGSAETRPKNVYVYFIIKT